jgi:AcrR family transcriptional regulator
MTTAKVDGRRLRREQNRTAVLDALVELFEEGNYQPRSNEIAERAGLSPRSLFRYFDDVDDLNRAAIQQQLERATPLLDPGVDAHAPTPAKIAAVVEARARLFEATAPAARSARVCAHRHPAIAAQVHDARGYLRRQLRRLFAIELDGDADRHNAVDVLCSFESWELLRHEHGLSRPKAIATLTNALTALLDPDGGPS